MSALRWMGGALRPLRPGVDAVASARLFRRVPATMRVTSPHFDEGGTIPAEYTADGAARFPGLAWSGVPDGTVSLALLVEDADIPFVWPVTHLVVHSIPPELGKLDAGGIRAAMRGPSPQGWACGRNFLGAAGWTPPAPPPGHGPHRYAFQLFALDAAPHFPVPPGRGSLLRRIGPHVIAQGRLFGVYRRD